MSKQTAGRRKHWTLRVGGMLLFAVLLAAAVYAVHELRGGGTTEAAVYGSQDYWRVQQGDLTISQLAPGEVRAKQTTEITCQVQGDVKIVWIVEEGTVVRKGDKLIELEGSGLEERLVSQQVKVSSNEARYVEALQGLEIQKRKGESDLLSAENQLHLAEIDLRKFEQGTHPQKLMDLDSEIKVATEEFNRAEEKVGWTEKLVANQYVSTGELKADQLALQKRQLDLEKSKRALEVYQQYEFERERSNLQNKVREAKDELERTKMSNERELRTREINMEAFKAQFDLEKLQLTDLQEQKAATLVFAPQEGMVVYSRDGGRRDSNRIEVGVNVYYRQKLIELPDFSQWVVQTRIHESVIQQVKPLMQAYITLDAFPEARLLGQVNKIAMMPDNKNWFMPDVKEYVVEVALGDNELPLKPGMSTKVDIMLADLKNVLFVPVQAVGNRDGGTVVWVKGETGPVMRKVEVGLTNDRYVEIKSGLEEGEMVLMSIGDLMPATNIVKRPSDKPEGENPEEGAEGVTPDPSPAAAGVENIAEAAPAEAGETAAELKQKPATESIEGSPNGAAAKPAVQATGATSARQS